MSLRYSLSLSINLDNLGRQRGGLFITDISRSHILLVLIHFLSSLVYHFALVCGLDSLLHFSFSLLRLSFHWLHDVPC